MKFYSCMTFLKKLRWIDGSVLTIEPYREAIFRRFFDERQSDGTLHYNLALVGRGKKNFKSADLALASLWALLEPTPGQHEVLLCAFDEDQGKNDLDLMKLLIQVNPALQKLLSLRENLVLRNDGRGYIKVLPGQSAAGEHGRTYRLLGIDEIHNQRSWDLLEALQPDPTRPNAQIWVTSYATLHHRAGVPLYDLMDLGKAGTDPRMLFSWYAADYCTDAELAERDPEARANPSMASWPEGRAYLEQQKRRLPSHKYNRLHLNLPGLPSGSAFQVEPILNAIERGVTMREPVHGVQYTAFVDMSGGSHDDAVLSIGHRDEDGRAIIDRLINQGQAPPFDPVRAVARFATVCHEYRIKGVVGDEFGGQTFAAQFEKEGVGYQAIGYSKSYLYESMEPHLNSRRIVLPDLIQLEQQLLGLVWRGNKIDHQPTEFDDWSNACAGCVFMLLDFRASLRLERIDSSYVSNSLEERQRRREEEEAFEQAEWERRALEGDAWLAAKIRENRVFFPGDYW